MACNSLSGTKYNLTQIQQILRQAGWPENLIAKAAAIVTYESGGYNRAYNGCGEDSYGWFQVYRRFHPEFEPNYDNGQIFDPVYNSQAGLRIYQHEGWNAWRNSNQSYSQDRDGVASQSLAIYNSGGNNVQPTVLQSAQDVYNLPVSDSQSSGFGEDAFIVALVGLGAILFIRRSY